MPTLLIELGRESIRAGGLIVFHLRYGLKHLFLRKRSSQNIILNSSKLRNILNSRLIQRNTVILWRPKQLLVILGNV